MENNIVDKNFILKKHIADIATLSIILSTSLDKLENKLMEAKKSISALKEIQIESDNPEERESKTKTMLRDVVAKQGRLKDFIARCTPSIACNVENYVDLVTQEKELEIYSDALKHDIFEPKKVTDSKSFEFCLPLIDLARLNIIENSNAIIKPTLKELTDIQLHGHGIVTKTTKDLYEILMMVATKLDCAKNFAMSFSKHFFEGGEMLDDGRFEAEICTSRQERTYDINHQPEWDTVTVGTGKTFKL